MSLKLNIDQHAIRAMTKSKYGVQPEFMTKQQASEVLGELSKQMGNGHAWPHSADPFRDGTDTPRAACAGSTDYT